MFLISSALIVKTHIARKSEMAYEVTGQLNVAFSPSNLNVGITGNGEG